MAKEDCLSADNFNFFIISKGRSSNVGQMQSHFSKDGPQPTWLVPKDEIKTYLKAGASYVQEVIKRMFERTTYTHTHRLAFVYIILSC